MIWYALAIFWSAFLLFLVQPILGKRILPWFGGTPAVWTTCLLFFQVLLLGGYLYAHGLTRVLKSRAAALVHLALLGASLWFLPIATDATYRSEIGSSPTWQILLLLGFTIGGPYFVLSATGPLLQAWFSVTHDKSPYRLYALSNVGSLLALLSYPFLVEPNLRLGDQTTSWSWGYAIFIVACALCAIQVLWIGWRQVPTASQESSAGFRDASVDRPTTGTMIVWLGLASSASAMLLATTNQICQEVAIVPFLWLLPLTLYLLSFIICFDSPRWYHRGVYLGLLVASSVGAVVLLFSGGGAPIVWQFIGYLAALFVCAMTCHGELVRSKPAARYLTLFYLLLATGGAMGGIFVALIAPRIFTGFWEYHFALVGCVLFVLAALWRDPENKLANEKYGWVWAVFLLLVITLVTSLTIQANRFVEGRIATMRSFYGVLRIWDEPAKDPVIRRLAHGAITHGYQFLDDRRRRTTSYYTPNSGVGLAIERHPRRLEGQGIKIGMIGLGTGTIAAYGQVGDVVRFYEINPQVIRVANEYFTYLEDSDAVIQIAEGDARLQLERELEQDGPQRFDVLTLDAFSSDAIPMHLLTKECVEMYFKHLKPDGILALHISNRNLDLWPIVRGLAEACEKSVVLIVADSDTDEGVDGTSWALMTDNKQFLKDEVVVAALDTSEDEAPPLVWTDDYGSLWQVLRLPEFDWRFWKRSNAEEDKPQAVEPN